MYSILFFASTLAADSEFSFFRELIQLFLTLVVVLGLAVVTLIFVRKMMRARATSLNHGAAIRIIEKRMLHAKASLYLVEVLGKGIVIAESASGIHMLTEFTPETNVARLMEELENEPPASPSFSHKLKELIRKKTAAK